MTSTKRKTWKNQFMPNMNCKRKKVGEKSGNENIGAHGQFVGQNIVTTHPYNHIQLVHMHENNKIFRAFIMALKQSMESYETIEYDDGGRF